MTYQGANSETEETEVTAAMYAGLNAGDIEAVMAVLHPEIERVEPDLFPRTGRYHGLDQLRTHFADGRATWAEGECTPERFFQVDDKVVVFVHVRVKLKATAEWVEGRIADGFRIKDGKIVYFETFHERANALAWAGIAEDEAT